MKVTLAAVVVLSFSACNFKQPPAQSLPATTTAETPKNPAPAETADKTVPIEITEVLVKKYLALQEQQLALLRAKVEQWKKEEAKLKSDPNWRQGAAYLAKVSEMSKEIDGAKAKLRARIGLAEAEVEQLGKVVNDISVARMLWRKGGGDATIADMEKQIKAQLTNLPPAQQAQQEAEMAKLTQGLKDARDAKDARKTYGDKTVDTVLKHDAELSKLLDEQMTLGLELR